MTSRRTRSDLTRARAVRNLAQAKEFLGLSWRGLAEKIQKTRGKGHVSHSYLIAMAKGDKPLQDVYIERVGQLIANKLTARYGREIAIRMCHHSPWRIVPVVWCGHCHKWNELKRANQQCHRCRRA